MDGGDFETLEPAGHIVENCEIYNCNSGLVVYGVGQIVRRNYIHDLPFQAVGYLGNDFLFEFNYITMCATIPPMPAFSTAGATGRPEER